MLFFPSSSLFLHSHALLLSSDMAMAVSMPFLLLLFALVLVLVSCWPFDAYPRHHDSFHFPDFSSDEGLLTMVGDAQITSTAFPPSLPSVQVSGSKPLSVGSFFYSKPVRFAAPGSSRFPPSFSSAFSFSMSSNEGNGLAFVVSPASPVNGADGPWLGLSSSSTDSKAFSNSLAVEFDSVMNKEMKDPNDNHAGINIESLVSLATANASDVAIKLNDGSRLYAWIDYQAHVHVLEVRLSKSQCRWPLQPLLSYRVDLSKILKQEMYVGFSSSTGHSPQKHIIYSWNFVIMNGGMHSFPANPHATFPQGGHPLRDNWHERHSDKSHYLHHDKHGRRQCHDCHWYHSFLMEVLQIGMSLALGALIGTVVAVCLLLVWTFLRRVLKPSNLEVAMHPILFGYRKLLPEAK